MRKVLFATAVIAAMLSGQSVAVNLEDSQTRIHVKDADSTEVNIEMPSSIKKKITFDAPKLTVEDKGFNPNTLAQTDSE